MKNYIVLPFVLFLISCGGGSSTPPANTTPVVTTPTTVNRAEGLYLETNTVRLQKINFIIKDTLFMGLAGQTDVAGQMLAADGVLMGVGSSSGGTYSANLNYYSSGVKSATLSASDAKLNNLTGTLIVGGVSQPLSADAPSSAAYTYAKAASLQDVLGDWTMNRTIKMNINNLGFISGSEGGCSFSGLILPDTLKNVYIISVTDAKTLACGVSGGIEAKGYAVSYLLSNGKRQFMIIAQAASINAARGLAGVR